MTDTTTQTLPGAATTASGHQLNLPGSYQPGPILTPEATAVVRESPGGRMLAAAFGAWQTWPRELTHSARRALAGDEAIDPNDPATWQDSIAHTTAILRRHGLPKVNPGRLTNAAIKSLVEHQRQADIDAGIDWSTICDPATMTQALRVSHTKLGVNLTDPRVWLGTGDKRAVLADQIGVEGDDRYDISRWALDHPDEFDPELARCWRIGSKRWFSLIEGMLEPVDMVERPVGLFITPTVIGEGFCLTPSLSLPMLRLVRELGGRVDMDLAGATIPGSRSVELLQQINRQVLHAGEAKLVDQTLLLRASLTRTFGVRVDVAALTDPLDRFGRLTVVSWGSGTSRQLRLGVMTIPGRRLTRRQYGSVTDHPTEGRKSRPGASMELGEAVSAALDSGLPLLLSSEVSGELAGSVRVGRAKGRPAMLSITTADDIAAQTEMLTVDQALPRLRALVKEEIPVVVDGGARQAIRMARTKPLADDPMLLGRQTEITALKVVGSGLDASATGTGKTVTTGRALAHRAARQLRLRSLVIAEGRLLAQWQERLALGAPGRGMPALCPNAKVVALAESHQSLAAQLRALDREAGERPLVVLAANSMLDRFPHELAVVRWHLLVADEALRYANPATIAHRSLRALRIKAAADCWLLSATPKGKTAEHLDVLVGLSLGDEAMMDQRLATREAGSLLDEANAHRLRLHYGPHLVRVTKADMAAWMPAVLPAQPLAIDPDPALIELLEAIRAGGRDAYKHLVKTLAALKTQPEGSEAHSQALAELGRAQGNVLGNVGVYLDASVDPETLTRSKAALAVALHRKGLVERAMAGSGDGLPLMRSIVADTISRVARDEQVLVFAERVWCLRQLAHTLRDRHGVETHVADGSLKPSEFEALKARFTAGEFPVMCLSPIGQEGHDLQNASVVVHYDLPWVHTALEQRVGRVARPGSRNDYVSTYIPYIRGAGIEHVVSILSERGAEHHQILDSFDGVKAKDSAVAGQLGQITAEVAGHKADAGYAGTAARLRVAAAVFGN